MFFNKTLRYQDIKIVRQDSISNVVTKPKF